MLNFFFKNYNLLLVGFLTAFSSGFGQTYFISLFGGHFRDLLNLTNAQFGSYYSIATILSAITLIWAGKVIDSIPLRKYVTIILVGLALTCLFVSTITNIIMFIIGLYFLRLFGQGLMGHTSRTTMSRYFNQNRGKALAVSSYGLALGEMIYPITIVTITFAIGWRYTWLTSAIFIIIFFGTSLSILLKNHNKRHEDFLNTQSSKEGVFWRRREVLRDIKFYCYLPSTLLMPFALTGLFFHQVHIATLKNWNLKLIAIGLIFYAVSSIMGSTISGILVDKFKARRLIPYFLIPFFLVLIFLMFKDGPIMLFFYMSVIGFTQAVGENISGSLWAELYGVKNLGSIKALMTFFGVLASAASPFLFGVILDIGNTLNFIILGTMILVILFSVLSYLAKILR
ncbi:MFS transporter [Alphaproteobacteria bacterium]|nr:MFS transporter [Alphaproteobacteria bacterium]